MNTAPPSKKIEYAIVCDDVRREDNGKLIIIGAYASDIGLSSKSANLRLSLLVAVRSETEHQTLVTARVMQDGKPIFEPKGGVKIRMPAKDIAMFSFGSIPVAIEAGKMLDFQVRFDQGRYRSACKIQVREQPSYTSGSNA